ncbi:MAG: BrxA/BrxB family bacilliredoxin [Phycisphaeraceae bacterium]|nr:BrxA/BrxB family bacilliredoxin [Phycisphaeraceae bacterium]
MPYPELMVGPMREDLVKIGFDELRQPEEVDTFVARPGTAMVVVNSVCGCAAGKCRPGVALATQADNRPQHLGTVFAGNDPGTDRLREIFNQVPPSSPSIYLLKDGQLFDFVPRHLIENQEAEPIAAHLKSIFDRMAGS